MSKVQRRPTKKIIADFNKKLEQHEEKRKEGTLRKEEMGKGLKEFGEQLKKSDKAISKLKRIEIPEGLTRMNALELLQKGINDDRIKTGQEIERYCATCKYKGSNGQPQYRIFITSKTEKGTLSVSEKTITEAEYKKYNKPQNALEKSITTIHSAIDEINSSMPNNTDRIVPDQTPASLKADSAPVVQSSANIQASTQRSEYRQEDPEDPEIKEIQDGFKDVQNKLSEVQEKITAEGMSTKEQVVAILDAIKIIIKLLGRILGKVQARVASQQVYQPQMNYNQTQAAQQTPSANYSQAQAAQQTPSANYSQAQAAQQTPPANYSQTQAAQQTPANYNQQVAKSVPITEQKTTPRGKDPLIVGLANMVASGTLETEFKPIKDIELQLLPLEKPSLEETIKNEIIQTLQQVQEKIRGSELKDKDSLLKETANLSTKVYEGKQKPQIEKKKSMLPQKPNLMETLKNNKVRVKDDSEVVYPPKSLGNTKPLVKQRKTKESPF